MVFLFPMKKVNRVRKPHEFQSLIKTGKKLANHSFVLYYVPKKEEQARVGISLPRKIGNAVQRNKYKRQLRMMCQELVDFSRAQKDLIIIIRFGYLEHDYRTNKNNLEKLLLKAKM